MTVRLLASLLAAAFVLLGACKKSEQSPATPQRPNIVVITVDTLRADHLGCYGFEAARTPNIDALATQGVKAEHATAATPITLPSHSSIFTGLYPPAHGVRDNGIYKLPDEVDTLAERLSAEGYRTQAFVSAWVLHHRFNLSQGFDGYDDILANEGDPGMFRVPERSGKATMDGVLRWLDSATVASEPAPFFLWVHLFDPHQPYAPPEQDAAESPTLYDGEIASVDRQIGRLIQKLTEKNALDDTLLVFTSDHGESLGEHGEATHAIFIYESTIRVPFIVRYPAKLPGGKSYRGPVRAVDVMPTILGLAELKQSDTQGMDLSKAMAGAAEAPSLTAYSESIHPELEFGMAPLHGVRSNQWTYIRAPRPELYDRSKDPGETRNLLEDADGSTAQNARVQALALEKTLVEIVADGKRFGFVSDTKPVDAETAKMLQALGYMEVSDAPQGVAGMDPKDGIRAFNDMDQARQLSLEGRYAEAKKVLEALLERVPTNASARNLLAMCEIYLGNMDVVEDLYRESLAHEPRQPEVLTQLGRLRFAEGKLEAARARFHEALKVDPAFIPAMIFMAHVEWKDGKPEAAASWYDKAIEADPHDPRAYQQYGDLYFRQKDFEKAKSWYEKALDAQPSSYLAALQSGMSAMQLGELQVAQGYFRRASQNDPSSWKPIYNLACVQVRAGKPDAAFGYLQEAVGRGFNEQAVLRKDPCFQPLHSDPRFVAIAGE
ncbi:MAG: sulfatase-like hydrolase/transferase [Polyangiales bacterium]